MPINQPPISDDLVQSSWQYEATRTLNELELRLAAFEGDYVSKEDLRTLIDEAPSYIIFYYNVLELLGEEC